MVRLVVLALFSLLFTYCTTCDSNAGNNSVEKSNLYEILNEKLGKKPNVIKNSSESHALCIKTSNHKKSQSVNHVKFVVIDLSDNSIIFEDAFVNGSVSWQNDHVIVAKRIPGMIAKPPSDEKRNIRYKFDILKRKKI